MKETKKPDIKHSIKRTSKPVKTSLKSKAEKKSYTPDDSHWIKSQAKLVKILEASGMMPEHQKPMLTCNRDR